MEERLIIARAKAISLVVVVLFAMACLCICALRMDNLETLIHAITPVISGVLSFYAGRKSRGKWVLFFVLDFYAPHTGEWEGRAIVKNRVLAFSQNNSFYNEEDGYIIIIFTDDNTAIIQTTSGSIGEKGAGVTFNGEYKREKNK